jgi:hypothetical protein
MYMNVRKQICINKCENPVGNIVYMALIYILDCPEKNHVKAVKLYLLTNFLVHFPNVKNTDKPILRSGLVLYTPT